MTEPRISVIIVSRGRPETLSLCLSALGQQYHPGFEIVVVADAPGCAAARAHRLGSEIRIKGFETANISAARNLGLSNAGGDIIAFIDDDAFAEPTWLARLTAPLTDPSVAAVGGFTRGRNGISPQWQGRLIDTEAQHHPLEVSEAPWQVFDPAPGTAIRTEGANCAFRRNALAELGGFDTAYRFFLDDADLNMRISRAGLKTALVPMAQVVHVTAPSEQRDAQRMPRDLFEIGASAACFLGRYALDERRASALEAIRDDQRRKLLRHMVAGHCVPGDVARLLERFDAGAAKGRDRPSSANWVDTDQACFVPAPSIRPTRRHVVIGGWRTNARRLKDTALAEEERGAIVSLMIFSASARFHRVSYQAPGIWVQTGGVWGRSIRSKPLFQNNNLQDRIRIEQTRVEELRGIAET
ncbi:MAG: glycosyltransferase family 2 protein [Alphaproteobacteria bacterium]|nr:glycosyltransferase family 2 protein [Alphaproteobacteria bacterium]